jgi:hypothetical protein
VFGLCGYFWRRLPERTHHFLAPTGSLLAVAGYLALALDLRSGTSGGWQLQVILVLLGGMLALAFSPLVTHALVHVPLAKAADASGLITTTMQLGQAVGVATFGSVFLTLAARPAPHASAQALSATLDWVAVALVLAVATAIPLARTVAGARRARSASQ